MITEEKCNEYYLTLFKSRIIDRICASETAARLIDPAPDESLTPKEVLRREHVFDYNYVTDATAASKVLLCIEALPASFHSPMIDVMIQVRVYVHRDKMQPDQESICPGNRCDQLTQMIGTMLNGSADLGGIGEIRPFGENYIRTESTNPAFYEKCMIFQAKISNMELMDYDDH